MDAELLYSEHVCLRLQPPPRVRIPFVHLMRDATHLVLVRMLDTTHEVLVQMSDTTHEVLMTNTPAQ